jgi:pyruvate kinase
VTILHDLQGPKIRVGQLPGGEMVLGPNSVVAMVPEVRISPALPRQSCLDYSHAAEEAKDGMRILLDDGLMQLEVLESSNTLRCRVADGGVLKSRRSQLPNESSPAHRLLRKTRKTSNSNFQDVDCF